MHRSGYALRRALLATASAALWAAFWPAPAAAALGDSEQSVQADGARMGAKVAARITAQSGYMQHELTAASGTVVREFVAPSGVVFAVAWQGPFMPDLRQLLGASFDTYVQSSNRVRGGHSHVTVTEPALVVESTGHARAFHGRAWLPTALPAGVALDAIK